jgi:hypothetical protein
MSIPKQFLVLISISASCYGGTMTPWTSQPKWTDGYRHLLPRGPAPARNESVYLARTIRSDAATTPTLRIYAEDFI